MWLKLEREFRKLLWAKENCSQAMVRRGREISGTSIKLKLAGDSSLLKNLQQHN
jgi:hypothetical protein